MKTPYDLSYSADKEALKRFEASYGVSLFDSSVDKLNRKGKTQRYCVFLDCLHFSTSGPFGKPKGESSKDTGQNICTTSSLLHSFPTWFFCWGWCAANAELNLQKLHTVGR